MVKHDLPMLCLGKQRLTWSIIFRRSYFPQCWNTGGSGLLDQAAFLAVAEMLPKVGHVGRGAMAVTRLGSRVLIF
jgi:hypothetical protein